MDCMLYGSRYVIKVDNSNYFLIIDIFMHSICNAIRTCNYG